MASRGNLGDGRTWSPRHPDPGSGRMAYDRQDGHTRQHNPSAFTAESPGVEPRREHLAVHARQLALKQGLPILRPDHRPLLRRMEQAHRSALENNVHRITEMGKWVLNHADWYKMNP